VRFMRGKYRLDEAAGMYYDTPCVRFRQGKKTTEAEREKFEAIKHEFPLEIQELYGRERTL